MAKYNGFLPIQHPDSPSGEKDTSVFPDQRLGNATPFSTALLFHKKAWYFAIPALSHDSTVHFARADAPHAPQLLAPLHSPVTKGG
ncbi:MAG TPA: hypothetical protein PK071_04305 [Atopobiaceae bacterium]|nr:hypothetical protein [Atopobiaceae bacterium]